MNKGGGANKHWGGVGAMLKTAASVMKAFTAAAAAEVEGVPLATLLQTLLLGWLGYKVAG